MGSDHPQKTLFWLVSIPRHGPPLPISDDCSRRWMPVLSFSLVNNLLRKIEARWITVAGKREEQNIDYFGRASFRQLEVGNQDEGLASLILSAHIRIHAL